MKIIEVQNGEFLAEDFVSVKTFWSSDNKQWVCTVETKSISFSSYFETYEEARDDRVRILREVKGQ